MPQSAVKNPTQFLIDAVQNSNKDAVRTAVQDLKTDINARDNNHLTVLHLAIQNRDYDMVVLLLSLGADPNAPDSIGDTPVFLAAGYGEAKILEKLIAHKGDADALNNYNTCALMRAAYHDHAECCEILLNHMKKLTIDHQDESNNTAVMWAVISGRTKALEVLLRHDPDLTLKDNQNRTAFGLASWFDMLDANNMMLDYQKNGVAAAAKAAFTAQKAAEKKARREAQTGSRLNRHAALRNYLRR